MTTKELFENLLAGKKMTNDSFVKGCYIYLNSKGELIGHSSLTNTNQVDCILVLYEYGYKDMNWQEYKEEILTEKEQEYLSNVIKPFRDKICYIYKRGSTNKEFITIAFGCFDMTSFPLFDKGAMYKGMEVNKKYDLEELGL